MSLVEVKGLNFKYTDVELYNDAEFKLNRGEHVILVGTNGCGKSTFMKILSKNIIPDTGTVTWTNNVKYSYLDQHLEVKNNVSVHHYLYGVFDALFSKEKQMNKYYDELAVAPESEYDKLLNRATRLGEELERDNFYAINSTIGNIINGLGISEYLLDQELNNLSGGQRAKIYLAKMLLESRDVLLMDEPTNFLDTSHVEWLIKFLNAYEGAFIVITHDKEFGSAIAKIVYGLENKKVVKYNGDYAFYLREHEVRLEHYEKQYANQQKLIKQTENFIQRNIVRASTTKRAQSRRNQLEKLDVIVKPKGDVKMHFSFPYGKDLGQEVLKLSKLVIGYDSPLLPPLDLLIKKNEKVAILGHNGVGKTTILKTILGEIEPLDGTFKFNPSSQINYFSQVESYGNINAVNYLREYYPLKTDGELRTQLANLGLTGDMVIKPMSDLSGGEQTKVRIALMTMKKSNILIFDEPTNHLDKRAKEYLYKAIREFPGSVILVSHEKDFYTGLLDKEIDFK